MLETAANSLIPEVISKTASRQGVLPNLDDYARVRAAFSWDGAARGLSGLPGGGGINIAHEAVDRHAAGARAGHLALRWLGKDGTRRDITYRDLCELTNRFANVLQQLGVGAGQPVFVLAGRIPELYVSILGALKNRCVASPLFSAFGPEPIHTRLSMGEGVVLVTTESLYRKKLIGLKERLPKLRHILVVSEGGAVPEAPGVLDFGRLMACASPVFGVAPTGPEDRSLLHFTSGTTGKPKGAVHVHGAVVAHRETGRLALDLHPDDVFWCTADPGWVTGTSYGIISPLTNGVTSIVDESDFDAERWYSILKSERVSVWYTAPTAVRMMMKGGAAAARRHAFPDLRFIASVGEPLNPQAVMWGSVRRADS